MFGLGKRKEVRILAPMSGTTLPIDKVADEVFSQKILGDGIAVEPTSGEVVAPADGMLHFITDSRHAFGVLLDNGMEVLVHVGIDTIKLKGEGFTLLQPLNTPVRAGTPVLRVDTGLVRQRGFPLTTMVIMSDLKEHVIAEYAWDVPVEAGKTGILVCR